MGHLCCFLRSELASTSRGGSTSGGRGSRGGRGRRRQAADSGSNYNSDYLYYMNEAGSRSGAFLNSIAASAASAAAFNGGSPSRSSCITVAGANLSGGGEYEEMEEPLFTEQHPNKLCALCNLSERSVLGQGEIVKFKVPTDIEIVQVIRNRRKALGIGELNDDPLANSNEKEEKGLKSGSTNHAANVISVLNARRKGRKLTSGEIPEPTDELENIGFIEEPDHNLLFETDGRKKGYIVICNIFAVDYYYTVIIYNRYFLCALKLCRMVPRREKGRFWI